MNILMISLAYVLGSIPFGLLLTWAAGFGDIRDIGSGNIGATNVLRTGRKGLAALTLLLDMAKGFAVVFMCQKIAPQMAPLAAFVTVIGHNFPIWLRFKGGKGIATTLGVTLGLNPLLAALLIVTWLVVFVFSRISSLSALVAALCAPFFAFLIAGNDVFLTMLALSAMAILRHQSNIRRLITGNEPPSGLGGHSHAGKA